MNKRLKRLGAAIGLTVVLGGAALALAGCESDSDTASRNISTEAEQFRVQREIVLYNGITDKYIAVVVGKCSVDESDIPSTLAVTCKVGPDKYIKDYWRNADNVTWFELQQDAIPVDVYHTEFVLKPAAVLPYVNIETGKNGATGNDGDQGSEFTQVAPDPSQKTQAVVPGKTGGDPISTSTPAPAPTN